MYAYGCLQDMSLDRMVRLENFAVLMHSLQPAKQRQLAAAVVAHASEERTDRIRSAQQMAVLARMVQPLISADSPAAGVVRPRPLRPILSYPQTPQKARWYQRILPCSVAGTDSCCCGCNAHLPKQVRDTERKKHKVDTGTQRRSRRRNKERPGGRMWNGTPISATPHE